MGPQMRGWHRQVESHFPPSQRETRMAEPMPKIGCLSTLLGVMKMVVRNKWPKLRIEACFFFGRQVGIVLKAEMICQNRTNRPGWHRARSGWAIMDYLVG
ncbi:Uncharacterized protein HZ326_12340 [Fusarium oxysporum f. sp. albedinis]|nr:Uncharacterized protein HZ326_12340 [Fusarium oxysporum f. sp. albedinis]